jgi:hypothetical protein
LGERLAELFAELLVVEAVRLSLGERLAELFAELLAELLVELEQPETK